MNTVQEGSGISPHSLDDDRQLTPEEILKTPFQLGEMFKWKGTWFKVAEINFKSLKLVSIKR